VGVGWGGVWWGEPGWLVGGWGVGKCMDGVMFWDQVQITKEGGFVVVIAS